MEALSQKWESRASRHCTVLWYKSGNGDRRFSFGSWIFPPFFHSFISLHHLTFSQVRVCEWQDWEGIEALKVCLLSEYVINAICVCILISVCGLLRVVCVYTTICSCGFFSHTLAYLPSRGEWLVRSCPQPIRFELKRLWFSSSLFKYFRVVSVLRSVRLYRLNCR